MPSSIPYRFTIRSTTTKNAPLPSDLLEKELAFSFVSDGLFIKYPDGSVRQVNQPGAASWGSLVGNIDSQSDLVSRLNSKQDLLNASNGVSINGSTISIDFQYLSTYLALGTSAVLNVGTTVGTVAAGNHTHTKNQVGLGNVDNTSDLNKPISTATQVALNAKQDLLVVGDGISIVNGVISSIGGAGASIISWNSIQNKPTTFNPSAHAHIKSEVGLQNVDNTSDSNKPISTATQVALNTKIDASLIGAPNGLATLDNTSKIPASELPASIIGSLNYQGTWDANSNIPVLSLSTSSNKGFYYEVSVAGSTTLSGVTDWKVGDLVVSNGTTWKKIHPVSDVTSVAGKTGAVTLVKADVGLANVDNTSDLNKPISTATQVALDAKESSSNKNAANGYAGLDSSSKVSYSNLPTLLSNALVFVNNWNASTNIPSIPTASASNKWNFYIVSVPGTTSVSGISKWNAGDWIVSDGIKWIKIQTSDSVTSVAGKTGDITLAISDITGLQAALTTGGVVSSVAGKTGVVTLAISDITGLQAALTTAGSVTSVASKTGAVTLVKADVGLANVDNTSDLNKPISTANQVALDLKANNQVATTTSNGLLSNVDKTKLDSVASGATANSSDVTLLNRANHTGTQAISTVSGLQSALDAKESSSNKNAANGYAGLDANGKILTSTLPASIVGSLNYQGLWDASLNSPTIPTAALGNKGFYYRVSVAGVTTINGISSWNIGDWIVSNGTTWEKIKTRDSVTSVAGKTGAVTLSKSDVALGNVDNTSDSNKPISTATQSALNTKAGTSTATTTSNGLLSNIDKVKLDSVASGATANSTDFYLLNRTNHTGTQAISTVAGLQGSLDAKESSSNKNAANGYAGLDANGKILDTTLPSSLTNSITTISSDVQTLKQGGSNGSPTPDVILVPGGVTKSGNILEEKQISSTLALSVVDFTLYGVIYNSANSTQIINGDISTGGMFLIDKSPIIPVDVTKSTATFLAGSTVTINGVGSLSLNANGTWTFVADASYIGSFPTIKYRVTDGTNTITYSLILLSSADFSASVGGTNNSSDAYLLDRANHTGTQSISTISGLQTALNSKLDSSGIPPLLLTSSAISGTAQQGYTLSRTSGKYTGTLPLTVSGNWQRNGVDIAGATGSTYTLALADVGTNVRWRDNVTNAAAISGVDFYSSTLSVTALQIPAAITFPSYTGTVQQGQTLTLVQGTYSNLGAVSGIQWTRNGADISGATSPTYVAQAADVGTSLAIKVNVTNSAGTASISSVGTIVQPLGLVEYHFLIGENTGSSYTGSIDSQSTRSNSDAISNYGSATDITVSKWDTTNISNGLIKFSGISNISGPVTVTSAKLQLYCSYAHQESANNNTLSLYSMMKPWKEGEVSWLEYALGQSWQAPGGIGSTDHDSTASASVVAPATSGSWIEFSGSDLIADVQNFINGSKVNYGWLIERSDITGLPTSYTGDSRKFTSKEGTNGFRPKLLITLSGSNVNLPKPIVDSSPVISGLALAGQTLTASNGTWYNFPSSYKYQWYRAGVAISGATSNTYVLTSNDVNQQVTCSVEAANTSGSTIDISSSVTALIPPTAPITDNSIKSMLSVPQPALLAGFSDPAFGTFIRRITDASSQYSDQVAKPVYSTIPTWNSDESKMIVWVTSGSQSGFALLNGQTYAYIKMLSLPGILDIEHFMWSATDPDIIFYDYASGSTKQLRKMHISTSQVDVVFTHPASTGNVGFGGDPKYSSWNNNIFGFFDEGTNKAFTRNVTTGVESPRYTADVAADISPSGAYYVISVAGVATAYRTSDNTVVRTLASNWSEHGCFTQLSDGRDVWVSAQYDNTVTGNGNVIVEYIDTGEIYTLLGESNGYGYPSASTHISGLAFNRKGWVAASIVGNINQAGLLQNEIVMCNLNTRTYQRVAHMHTLGNNNSHFIFAEAHANISPSGTRIAFASDWGSNADVNTFVVELPPAWLV